MGTATSARKILAPTPIEEPKEMYAGVRYEMRVYLYVLASLLLLTGLSLGVWALHFPAPYRTILAVAIAVIKVSLIASFFMHLLSERGLLFLFIGLGIFYMLLLVIGSTLIELESSETMTRFGGHYLYKMLPF